MRRRARLDKALPYCYYNNTMRTQATPKARLSALQKHVLLELVRHPGATRRELRLGFFGKRGTELKHFVTMSRAIRRLREQGLVKETGHTGKTVRLTISGRKRAATMRMTK